MTYNSQGLLCYKDHEYDIIEVDGIGLFDPADIGIVADADPMCDHQGFSCSYTVENDRLVLDGFSIEFDDAGLDAAVSGKGPMVFGQLPKLFVFDEEYYEANNVSEELRQDWSTYYYDCLNQPVAFTGTLLLAARDEVEPDCDWFDPEPCQYDEFQEFTFENGKLVYVKECTSELG